MNSNTIKGNYKQIRGKIKVEWAKLTDDDLAYADGKLDQLVGKIQHLYGTTREEIQKKIDSFVETPAEKEDESSRINHRRL